MWLSAGYFYSLAIVLLDLLGVAARQTESRLAVMSNDRVFLRSRNNSDFNAKTLGVVRALAALLDDAVVDGEVVALDRSGRSSFNALQNLASSKLALVYYIFEVVRSIIVEPPSKRRDLLRRQPWFSRLICRSRPLRPARKA